MEDIENIEKENIETKIEHLTKEIRLPGIRKNYKVLTEEFSGRQDQYVEFLYKLLEIEYHSREKSRVSARIRQAGFPYKKYLEELKREELPEEARLKLKEFEQLEFIRQGRNIILSGNPGTGKTHIAIGLGIKACLKGYKVLFTSVHRLITQIKESRSDKKLRIPSATSILCRPQSL